MKKGIIIFAFGALFGMGACGDPSQPAGKETARVHEADNAIGQNTEVGYNVVEPGGGEQNDGTATGSGTGSEGAAAGGTETTADGTATAGADTAGTGSSM